MHKVQKSFSISTNRLLKTASLLRYVQSEVSWMKLMRSGTMPAGWEGRVPTLGEATFPDCNEKPEFLRALEKVGSHTLTADIQLCMISIYNKNQCSGLVKDIIFRPHKTGIQADAVVSICICTALA